MRLSYHHNWNHYAGKMASLYWDGPRSLIGKKQWINREIMRENHQLNGPKSEILWAADLMVVNPKWNVPWYTQRTQHNIGNVRHTSGTMESKHEDRRKPKEDSALFWLVKLWNYYKCRVKANCLTHWGRVTHLCVGKLTIIGSDNGLSPGRCQAIILTIAGILLIEPLGTNFSEIIIRIQTFSFKKMHLKMASAKWRPFVSASMC